MSDKTSSSGVGGLILIAAALAFVLYQNNSTPITANAGAVDEAHARAFVAGDFAFAGSSTPDNPAPQPEPPKPTPGKCPVCNGTGKVGDGRIFVDCGTCKGDGKIDPDDVASTKCQCGPDCKCKTDPNNPDCKCDKCACDLVNGEQAKADSHKLDLLKAAEINAQKNAETVRMIEEMNRDIRERQRKREAGEQPTFEEMLTDNSDVPPPAEAEKPKEPYEEPRPEADASGPLSVINRRVAVLYFQSADEFTENSVAHYEAFMKLKRQGWDTSSNGQLRMVLVEDSPALAKACGVEKSETWVRVFDGKVTAKHTGRLDAFQIAAFYETGKIEQPKPKVAAPVVPKVRSRGGGRWVQQCGPNGCRMQWLPFEMKGD